MKILTVGEAQGAKQKYERLLGSVREESKRVQSELVQSLAAGNADMFSKTVATLQQRAAEIDAVIKNSAVAEKEIEEQLKLAQKVEEAARPALGKILDELTGFGAGLEKAKVELEKTWHKVSQSLSDLDNLQLPDKWSTRIKMVNQTQASARSVAESAVQDLKDRLSTYLDKFVMSIHAFLEE